MPKPCKVEFKFDERSLVPSDEVASRCSAGMAPASEQTRDVQPALRSEHLWPMTENLHRDDHVPAWVAQIIIRDCRALMRSSNGHQSETRDASAD